MGKIYWNNLDVELQTDLKKAVDNISSSDEKVKMNISDSTSGYLEDKIDNVTIKSELGKLVAESIKGLTVGVDKLNFLSGATSNIQGQLDSLSSIINVKEIVATKADLPSTTLPIGSTILVRQDESNGNLTTFYVSNGTVLEYGGKINTELARNFTTEPINLVTESTNILPKSRYEKQNSLETPFDGTSSQIVATNAQDAIKEVKNSTTSSIDALSTNLASTNTLAQQAFDLAGEEKVTSPKIVSALGYTPANQTTLDTHINSNATTTSKGHVQIGSGLTVLDGVVSTSPISDTSKSVKGLVQVGDGLNVAGGVISVPEATVNTKGIVQVGSGLSVVGGVVNVNPISDATISNKGLVQVGEGLNVTSGTISVPDATNSTKGKIQVGSGLSVSNGTVSVIPTANATTTTKGVMQVGNGLSVSDGVVSVTPTYTNSFDIDTPYADLPFGETITPVSTNIAMENYKKLTALTNTMLGLNLEVANSTAFRYTMQTVKVVGASYQKVDVFYNYPDNMNKAFEFYRVIDAGAFQEWSVNALEICEVGKPDYNAFRGTLATDVTTGIKYVKSTGTTLPANNSGWIAINAPKQFLSVGRGETTQTITAIDETIIFNTTPNTNMNYNNVDGTFYLEAGKQYRITVTGGFDFSTSTGLITLGMYNSSNQSANGSRAKWISTSHTLNEGQSAVLDFIHNTTASGRYKIVATVLSGTATARIESTRLVIQEI